MQVRTLRWEARARCWSGPLEAGDDGPSTVVFVFGTTDLDAVAQPLNELVAAFPSSALIGCSTYGEVCGDYLSDDGLVVAVCRFDHSKVSVAVRAVEAPDNSWQAGQDVANALVAADPAVTAVFVVADSFGINGSSLVAGMSDTLGPGVDVSGGLAGDVPNFARTWVLANGRPRPRYVAAVGFSGSTLRIGHGQGGGWSALGPERRITRSSGNVLFELDGQPALELYKRYLGTRANELPAAGLMFPLALRSTRHEEHSVLRTVRTVDETDDSVSLAGDVVEGTYVQLMRATFDQLIDAGQLAARSCSAAEGTATLALVVSCLGRRHVLGRRTEEELASTIAGLPTGSAFVGFYSYGEVSPYPGGTPDLLNQTLTVTTFQEVAMSEGRSG